MIKFSGQGADGPFVGLGLFRGNIERLTAGQPVLVRLAELGIPGDECGGCGKRLDPAELAGGECAECAESAEQVPRRLSDEEITQIDREAEEISEWFSRAAREGCKETVMGVAGEGE